MSMIQKILMEAGPIIWLLAFLAVVAVVLVAERLLYLHRSQISVPEFLPGIINVLRRGNVLEAISLCDDTPGPVAKIVRATLHHARDPAAQRQAIYEVGLTEIPQLERRLRMLYCLAHLAPLLGLLGTLGGMMEIFQSMEGAGTFLTIQQMSGGVWKALVSSAMGLIVAIPAYGFYHFFQTRVESILQDMEKAAAEMLYVLTEPLPLGEGATPAPANGFPATRAEVAGDDRQPRQSAAPRPSEAGT